MTLVIMTLDKLFLQTAAVSTEASTAAEMAGLASNTSTRASARASTAMMTAAKAQAIATNASGTAGAAASLALGASSDASAALLAARTALDASARAVETVETVGANLTATVMGALATAEAQALSAGSAANAA